MITIENSNVNKFIEKVSSDDALRDAFQQLLETHFDELVNKIIEFGEKNGFTFTREEMEQLVASESAVGRKQQIERVKPTVQKYSEESFGKSRNENGDFVEQGSWKIIH